MSLQREKWLAMAIILLFIAAITVPFLIANSSVDHNHVFSGFMLNPIDGHSYLAKMRQGLEGDWLFKLSYTANPGDGAAINQYYLFLGHLARALGWSLVFTFHAARVLGALFLGLALYWFFTRIFAASGQRLFALALVLFGSGLGWLAIGIGILTSDFWVAEAFPFLASYVSPHFALGLALQVTLLTPLPAKQLSWRRMALTIAAAAVLSVVYPFGWAVAAACWSAWVGFQSWQRMMAFSELRHWAAILLGGAPYPLYAFLVIKTHPALAVWDAQNLTPALQILDLLISMSPAILLAALGTWLVFKKKNNPLRFVAIWLMVGLVLIYLPFNLQRRLVSGLYIPISALAVYALAQLGTARWRRLAAVALLALALPTNAILILGGLHAVRSNTQGFTISQQEFAAFHWLQENAVTGSLVLAAPDSGLLLPAYASMRVLFGHPYETAHADQRVHEVMDIYSGKMTPVEISQYTQEWKVDFLLYGPREKELGELTLTSDWSKVYEHEQMEIWTQSQ